MATDPDMVADYGAAGLCTRPYSAHMINTTVGPYRRVGVHSNRTAMRDEQSRADLGFVINTHMS
jgi:hypothetical protein